MNRKRLLAILSATILAMPVTAASAADGATEAETAASSASSEASASAVSVDGIVTVSGTGASTANGGSANATVLGIGDEQIVGGSKDGEGEASGEVLTTGENEQGSLTVGGWRAANTGGTSSARTALVDGNLGGASGLTVTVLESNSEARSDGSEADTTAVIVDGGDGAIHVELLGAETASDTPGGAYLIEINGQRVFTSDDANGECALQADPVLRLLCLYAAAIEAGDAADPTGNGSGVAQFGVLEDALTGSTFTAEAVGNAGETTPPTPPAPTAPEPEPRVDDGPLPITGANALLSLLGLAGMGGSVSLRRWSRR